MFGRAASDGQNAHTGRHGDIGIGIVFNNAVAFLDLTLDPVSPEHYGRLVRNGEVLFWAPERAATRPRR